MDLLALSYRIALGSLGGWSFITCGGGGGSCLGVIFHFQKRKRYQGGHFWKSGIKKYFPVISAKKSM